LRIKTGQYPLVGLIFCPLGNQPGVVDDTDLGAIVTDNQGQTSPTAPSSTAFLPEIF
jgi:hypothetical protein